MGMDESIDIEERGVADEIYTEVLVSYSRSI